jgi:hypothetical protein
MLGAVVVVAVIVVVNLLAGDGSSGLPRQRITSPRPSPPRSSTAAASRPELTLGAGGLGVVVIGEPADDVVGILTERLGPPDEDEQQRCTKKATTRARYVRWADLSIQLLAGRFTAYVEGIHFPPGRQALDFGTARGLSPGDSAERLHSLYPRGVRVRQLKGQPGRPESQLFTITGESDARHLSGVIEQQGSGMTVTSLFVGELC